MLDSIFEQMIDDIQNRPLNDRLDEIATPTQIIWGRQSASAGTTTGTLQP